MPRRCRSSPWPWSCRSTANCAAHIAVAVDADEDAVRAAALADPHVQKFIGAAPIRKVIIVPGKLVNIVV